MNTSNAIPPVTQSLARRDHPHPSREAGQLIALGRAHYWPFYIIGRAPMIQEPVRLGDWLLIPAQQDTTVIPPRAMKRIRAIFEAGITPQGFVVVHEAPKLLKAPIAPRIEPKTLPTTIPSPQGSVDFAAALETGLSALASLLVPMLYLFVAAALVDPILTCITSDQYWVSIDQWDTE